MALSFTPHSPEWLNDPHKQHEDQLQKLRDHPSLVASATEELLRFDSPVQAITRRAKEDFELLQRQEPAGPARLAGSRTSAL